MDSMKETTKETTQATTKETTQETTKAMGDDEDTIEETMKIQLR